MWFIKSGFLLALLAQVFSDHIKDDYLCQVCGRYAADDLTTIRARVYKGEKSKYGPWSVFLKIDDQHLCSGSIIGMQHIITAAHCFEQYLDYTSEKIGSLVEVYAGSTKKDFSSFIKLKVKEVIVKNDFHIQNSSDPNTNTFNDLAIIRLKNKIQVTNSLRPICLGADVSVDWIDDEVVVQGYGTVNCVNKKKNESLQSSNELRETKLTVELPQVCQALYKKKFDPENMICVIGDEDISTTSCPGDSGGTVKKDFLIANEKLAYLVGIVSWGGPGDGQALGYPTVYARVFSYLDWIWSVTNEPLCPLPIEEMLVIYED